MNYFKCFDERTQRNVKLIRVISEPVCLGCFFLDEGDNCHRKLDWDSDCMNTSPTNTIHFQFKEVHECFHCGYLMNEEEYESAADCGCPSCRHKIKE